MNEVNLLLPERELFPKAEIKFIAEDPKFNMQLSLIEGAWKVHGDRILDAFKKVTGLPFIEEKLTFVVGKGNKRGHSHSGMNLTDPIKVRYDSSDPFGTLLHELTHRLMMEYHLWSRNHAKIGAKETHQMVALILYEVIKELFGQEAADLRVEHESEWRDPKYRKAWEWWREKTEEERAQLLKLVVDMSEGIKKD
jgi:hypothetical protein